MGVLKFLKRLRRSSANTGSTAAGASVPRSGGLSYYNLSDRSALSLAVVYRCVRLLADSVANLPMQYMRIRNGVFVEDTSSRLHYLLTVQPDYFINAFDFWAQLTENLLLDGNAYIVPLYSGLSKDIERLALCRRGTVAHDVMNDVYTVADPITGISGTYKESEIIHVRGLSTDGKHGISVLSFARLTLDIGASGDVETLSRFKNGGNVRGIIGNNTGVTGFGEYQDSQLESTAKDIDSRFQNGERIVSLPGQVQFNPISLSSTDMQFLESRKFTVREICRFFGVHPSFVFDDTSNNYKSAEMANVAFLSNTLNPILRKIENEFHRKLVPQSLCCKRKFQFDRRGLYACDLESRTKYQLQTIQTGLYTVNEWRKIENKEPVAGGDKVYISTNLQDINFENDTKEENKEKQQ